MKGLPVGLVLLILALVYLSACTTVRLYLMGDELITLGTEFERLAVRIRMLAAHRQMTIPELHAWALFTSSFSQRYSACVKDWKTALDTRDGELGRDVVLQADLLTAELRVWLRQAAIFDRRPRSVPVELS